MDSGALVASWFYELGDHVRDHSLKREDLAYRLEKSMTMVIVELIACQPRLKRCNLLVLKLQLFA